MDKKPEEISELGGSSSEHQVQTGPIVGRSEEGPQPVAGPGGLSPGDVPAELLTYRAALPALLSQEEEGRFALLKGPEVVSLWDTFGDAYQAGRQLYGLARFLVMPVDSRDLERLPATKDDYR
jgi:hypothetical protein